MTGLTPRAVAGRTLLVTAGLAAASVSAAGAEAEALVVVLRGIGSKMFDYRRLGAEAEALAVVSRWAEAFAASDVNAIVGLYAPDALLIGTGSRTVATGPDEIRRYFEDAFVTRHPRAAPMTSLHVKVLSEDAAVVTGMNDTTGVLDGKPYLNPGRVTFVIARSGPDWRIVHFHRSAVPR